MNFTTYHPQSLSAWVYVVETRFYCLYVPPEFLVNSVVRLGHCLVRVVDEAATKAGRPCSHTSTALPPAVHALTVAWHLSLNEIGFGQLDMFRFSSQSFILFLHFESL